MSDETTRASALTSGDRNASMTGDQGAARATRRVFQKHQPRHPFLRLNRVDKDWAVIWPSGSVEFVSGSYVKAVGVFEYLVQRMAAQAAERDSCDDRTAASPVTTLS